MKKEEAVGLGVRLFAIYLVLAVANYGANFPAVWESGTNRLVQSGVVLSSILLPLFVAWLLWRYPLAVARSLLPVTRGEAAESRFSLEEVQGVGFTLLGLFILSNQIMRIFFWFGFFVFAKNAEAQASFAMTPQVVGSLASTGTGMAIGLWLLFGARGLLGLVRRARSAGQRI